MHLQVSSVSLEVSFNAICFSILILLQGWEEDHPSFSPKGDWSATILLQQQHNIRAKDAECINSYHARAYSTKHTWCSAQNFVIVSPSIVPREFLIELSLYLSAKKFKSWQIVMSHLGLFYVIFHFDNGASWCCWVMALSVDEWSLQMLHNRLFDFVGLFKVKVISIVWIWEWGLVLRSA